MKDNIKYKIFEKKYPYMYLYIWMTFICLGMVFLHVCIIGGSVLSEWLFGDIWDTGNDFFNCIPAVKGYGLGYWLVSAYPPLAKLFFLVIARIYSYHNIPLDTTIRNSMTDPRMQQAALIPFIIFILSVVIAIIVLISEMFKDNGKQMVMAGVSIIGTYSIIFAIERGNCILLSFVFLMYFIIYNESENKWRRETALIFLALSAGFKFYPAAFGVLLLYKKRWKDAFRAIVYGIMSVAIPYIIVKKHLPQEEVSRMTGSIAEWGRVFVGRVFGNKPVSLQIFIAASIVVALVGIVCVGIKNNKYWLGIFYAGVLTMILGMQFEAPYAYVFLIPALVVFSQEEKTTEIKTMIYFLMLCIIHLPLPIFGKTYGSFPILGELKMYMLFVMIIIVTFIEGFYEKIIRKESRRNSAVY